MGEFSVWHWAIVAAVFMALFGYRKMPDAARSFGRSLRIFKSEIRGMQADKNACSGSGNTGPVRDAGSASAMTADAALGRGPQTEHRPSAAESGA